jgi:arylsulfatase A-like enzyme
LLLAAIVTVAHAGQATDTNVPPPNILLIVLDDFSYNDLGANGNPNTPTPYLDALAAQGIRYTRHDADTTCSVARAALMTGTYPAIHGLRPTHLGLSTGTPTIASMLRDAGYTTQHIGKWHIAAATLEQSPSQLGFDNWFGFLHQNELQGASSDGVHFLAPTYLNPWLRDNQSAPRQYPGHLTDILTERAIQFLDSQKERARPWFLNLWYYAPHQPIQPAARFQEKHPATKEGIYHALIEQLDFSIGEVLQALEKNGQRDNTLVIVVSDNGGDNAHTDNNYPFYGKKTEFNEGGLRTPLLMRWPGHVQSGAVSDEKVSLYDLFPTIAQASAATPPPHLIGRDLLGPGPRPGMPYYWEYSDSATTTYSVLSADGRWRHTGGSWADPVLNDLVSDPSGQTNVADAHPDIVRRLREDYLAWRLAARVVTNVDYQQLNEQGGALLRGDDLQRSPGRNGYTFAIGVRPADDDNGATQVIAEQVGRWRVHTYRSRA